MKRKNRLGFATTLTVVTCLPALAQQQEPISTHRLDQVEVTATRASAKTPMTFTNLGKKQLLKSNLGMDVPYLLLQTPSVIATSDPGFGIGYTYLRVRGVDAAGINTMTNGVPLNDSESQGVFWANMPNFSSSIHDVQLQRGVGTSSNGQAAFGASLNLRTDHFALEPTASVSLLGGSYHTFRRDVHASTGRIAGHWALEARLGKTSTDGYVDRSGTEGTSYFLQGGYVGELTTLRFLAFGGKQRTGIAWNGLSPADEAKYGRRYNSAGHMNPGSTPAEARYRYNTDNYEQNHYQLHFSDRHLTGWTLNLTGHYTHGYGFTDEYRTGRKLLEYGLQPFPLLDKKGNNVLDEKGEKKMVEKISLLRTKYLKNDFYGAIASAEHKDDKWEFTLGLAGNHYKGLHYGERTPITPYPHQVEPNDRYYDDTAHKTDLSGFVKTTLELTKGFNLFADLQYRFIDYRIKGTTDNFAKKLGTAQQVDLKKTFKFFNPKAGIFWQVSPKSHFYGSVAVAHREPSRNHYVNAGSLAEPRAERLTDWELGYGFRSRSFTAGLNFYYMKYKDQLVLNGKKSDVGADLSENVPNSYRMGLEINASWLIAPSLRWDLAFGTSKNRIKRYTIYVWSEQTKKNEALHYDNTQIAFSPNVTLSNTLTFSRGGFEAALSSQLVGRQYLDNTGSKARSIPSYHVENLRLSYDLPVRFAKGWNLSLQINNLLNRKYVSNGSGGFGLDKDGRESSWLGFSPQAGTHILVGTTLTL